MAPRLHVGGVALAAGRTLDLPPDAARHVQVLRLQPGAALTLFDSQGGEWERAHGLVRVAGQPPECAT